MEEARDLEIRMVVTVNSRVNVTTIPSMEINKAIAQRSTWITKPKQMKINTMRMC